jgi:hypothetical protein
MLRVANRIMLNFEEKFPSSVLRHPLAGVLNDLDSQVIWDLNGISHADSSGVLQRTVEIIIYHNESGRHADATKTVIEWVKRLGLRHYVLSAVDT